MSSQDYEKTEADLEDAVKQANIMGRDLAQLTLGLKIGHIRNPVDIRLWSEVPEDCKLGHASIIQRVDDSNDVRSGAVLRVVASYVYNTEVGWDLPEFVLDVGLLSHNTAANLVIRVITTIHEYPTSYRFNFSWCYYTLDDQHITRALIAFQPPGIYELAGL